MNMPNDQSQTQSAAAVASSDLLAGSSEHRHSAYEVLMSGAANACPICQASQIRILKEALETIVRDFEQLNGNECKRGCGKCCKCIAEHALKSAAC